MDIRVVPYDDPDAVKLMAEVQEEYRRRYGDPDETPMDGAEFVAPKGIFLVGYLDGTPVACGGWRAHDAPMPPLRAGDAEMKRVFVVDSVRGKGFARAVLAELERTARAAGRTRMVLETGTKQPEAIGLYLSSGYAEIDKFGVYANDPASRCYARQLR